MRPEAAMPETAARTPEPWVLRLRLLWQGRRTLARITAAGIALSVAVALLLPKWYESTARLMPPDANAGTNLAMLSALSGAAAALPGSAAGDLLGVQSSGALFIGILRSRTVQERMVERFGLRAVYDAELVEDAARRLDELTIVSEDRKSGILTLTVTDRSPERSAELAAGYIEELNRLVAEVSTSSAHRERVFLEERLAAVQEELAEAERAFSEFASQNTAIDIPSQGRALVDAAARLQGELIAAQAQLEGLRQIYTDNNARVREARARVTELERQLNKLGGAEAGSAEPAEAGAPPLYPSIRRLPLLGVTYAELYRRSRIKETVYEVLTQQYELAKVQEAKETPSVKVLDAPAVPQRKSFPPRTLIVLLGAMLSFALGVLWLLARAGWRDTDSGDPRKALALEIVEDVRAELAAVAPNGAARAAVKGLWQRLERRWSGRESSV